MSIPSILCCFFVHLRYFVLCLFMVNPTCNDISFSFWKVSSRACIVLVVSSVSLAWAEHCLMHVDMFPFRSSCFFTLSITILNKVADRGSPCLTPETILNSFVNWLPVFTFAVELVRVSPISFINFFGTSYLVRHSIMLFLCTQSNAWE